MLPAKIHCNPSLAYFARDLHRSKRIYNACLLSLQDQEYQVLARERWRNTENIFGSFFGTPCNTYTCLYWRIRRQFPATLLVVGLMWWHLFNCALSLLRPSVVTSSHSPMVRNTCSKGSASPGLLDLFSY